MRDEESPPWPGPWIELHLHLEGAAPPEFIRAEASRRGQRLDLLFGPDGGYAFDDFAHFLRVYELATDVLAGPDAYARLAAEVAAAQAERRVAYTEAALCPEFCGGADPAAWSDHLDAIAPVAGDGLRLIATAVRHLGPDAARRAARCAVESSERADGLVVGFGLAGDERAGRARDFAYAFDMAREAGLGLTAHAGEFAGPASIVDTLDALRPARIGHGVRAIENPALVRRLAAAGTVLEICPGANVRLGLYPSVAEHPVRQLRSAGVAVTLGTDDPAFFGTALEHDASALAAAHGWDAQVFLDLNRTAVRAAFCAPDTRSRLGAALDALDPACGDTP